MSEESKQQCPSLANGRDQYLDKSVEPSGECKPCLNKCYWTLQNSLTQFCLDLHARGDCLDWPRPRGSDLLNQSDVLLWWILAVILLCLIAFILIVVVFIILYIKRNHPRLKPFRSFLQRIRILPRETLSKEESRENAVAFSSPEERVNLVPESQTATNVANTLRSQQMQPGAYS